MRSPTSPTHSQSDGIETGADVSAGGRRGEPPQLGSAGRVGVEGREAARSAVPRAQSPGWSSGRGQRFSVCLSEETDARRELLEGRSEAAPGRETMNAAGLSEPRAAPSLR